MLRHVVGYCGASALALALGFGLGASWETLRKPEPVPVMISERIDVPLTDMSKWWTAPPRPTLEDVRRAWSLEGRLDCRTIQP